LHAHRFQKPWSADEADACFIVRDRNGQALVYIYFEDKPGRRTAANLLTTERAASPPSRRVCFVKSPEALMALMWGCPFGHQPRNSAVKRS
jgi:hypothetical protein